MENSLKVGDLRYGFGHPIDHVNRINEDSDIFAIKIISFTVKGDKYRWSMVKGIAPYWFGTGLIELDWGYATEREAYDVLAKSIEVAVEWYTNQKSRMLGMDQKLKDRYNPA